MRHPESTHDRGSQLFLLACVVMWAANYPVAKFGIGAMNNFIFNSLRYAIAFAVMFLWFRLSGSRWIPVPASDWARLIRAGLVANVLYQIAFIVGLNLTTAGNAAVLLATAPLWTIVLNAKLHRERVTGAMWTGILLSMAGVALIVLGGEKKLELSAGDFAGDSICLAAAFLWAANTNLQKPLLGRYSPMQLTLVMVGVGALGLLICALPFLHSMAWRETPWLGYGAAVLSGLFSIAVGNVIWSRGVQRLGPGRTGVFGNLIPVVALLIAYLLLGEELSPFQVLGAAVTVFGVWFARR